MWQATGGQQGRRSKHFGQYAQAFAKTWIVFTLPNNGAGKRWPFALCSCKCNMQSACRDLHDFAI